MGSGSTHQAKFWKISGAAKETAGFVIRFADMTHHLIPDTQEGRAYIYPDPLCLGYVHLVCQNLVREMFRKVFRFVRGQGTNIRVRAEFQPEKPAQSL